MKKNLIVCDPAILNGKPIVKGTRISVALILQCLSSGMSKEDILRGHPTLTQKVWKQPLNLRHCNSREKKFECSGLRSNAGRSMEI